MFNSNSADNLWDFEDFARRVHQRLFDPSLPRARQERNRHYRIGLLQIMDGLMNDSPFDVAEGVDRLASQFPKTMAFDPNPPETEPK